MYVFVKQTMQTILIIQEYYIVVLSYRIRFTIFAQNCLFENNNLSLLF